MFNYVLKLLKKKKKNQAEEIAGDSPTMLRWQRTKSAFEEPQRLFDNAHILMESTILVPHHILQQV